MQVQKPLSEIKPQKKIAMTKHAKELIVSKDTKVNANMEVIAKDTSKKVAVNLNI